MGLFENLRDVAFFRIKMQFISLSKVALEKSFIRWLSMDLYTKQSSAKSLILLEISSPMSFMNNKNR